MTGKFPGVLLFAEALLSGRSRNRRDNLAHVPSGGTCAFFYSVQNYLYFMEI